MTSWRNSCIPEGDVVFSILHYRDSRCSQSCCRYFQLLPGMLLLLPDAHRFLVSAPHHVTVAPSRSEVHSQFSAALQDFLKRVTITSMVLLNWSLEIPFPLKAGRNTLQGSDTFLKLMHLSLQFTSSQTLLEARRDQNTFC